MKKILKKIFFYLIFSISTFAITKKPIGDLNVTVTLYPYGTTKTYDMGGDRKGNFVLDAGIINSNDGLRDQKIAEVHVLMETKPTSGVDFNGSIHNACTIDGDFNGLFKLQDLYNKFNNDIGREIPLSQLTKYNGGENAKLRLTAENYRVTHKELIDEDDTGRDKEYIFTAYPKECKLKNKILVFGYKFDLILKAENIKPGDIVRGDIALDSTIKAASGKGALQDLIENQMKSIMSKY